MRDYKSIVLGEYAEKSSYWATQVLIAFSREKLCLLNHLT